MSHSRIEATIAEIESQSLKDYADSLEINYPELIEKLCDNINDLDDSSNLRTEQDFWEYRRRDSAENHHYAAELIRRSLESGALNEFMLKPQALRDRLGAALGESFVDLDIPQLVEQLPILHLSDISLNAIASLGDKRVPCPHIRHYFATERILGMVASSLVGHGIDYDPSTRRVITKRDIKRLLSDDHKILHTIRAALETLDHGVFALRASDIPSYHSFVEQAPLPLRSVAASVSTGGRILIWLHEIAHHLLDHFSSSAHLESEVEADLFAMVCLCATDQEANGLALTGGSITFALLSAVYPNPPDHPPSFIRAELFGKFVDTVAPALSPLCEFLLLPLTWVVLERLGYTRSVIQEKIEESIETLEPRLDAMGVLS